LLLAACGGSGGGGNKSNPNASLDIEIGGDGFSSGDRISGITVGQQLNVSFTNTGSSAVGLDPVLIAATDDLDVRDFVLEFDSNFTNNNVTSAGTPSVGDGLALPWTPVNSDPVFGDVYLPEPQAIADWAQASRNDAGPRWLEAFPLPGHGQVDLLLTPLEVPLDEQVQVVVDGRMRAEVPGEVAMGLSLWTGSIVGEPDSQVFLSFSPYGDRGWLRLAGETWMVAGEPDPVHGWTRSRTRVWNYARVRAAETIEMTDTSCQVLPPPVREPEWVGGEGRDSALNLLPPFRHDQGIAATVESGATRRCRLGFETDEDFFDQFGDATAATTYVTQLVAAVGHRYQQRVQTQMSLLYLSLYDTTADPWTSIEGGGTAEDLLDEFAAYWGTSWPGVASGADLGHLLSKGMNQGGIAYYADNGLLCNRSGGFGVSTGITASADWDNFAFNSSIGYWDFVVVAHEIGHNFGSAHTHDYCPPFDECSTAFGVCQTQRQCVRSTILSYCHTCVGGLNRIDPDFEAYLATRMRRNAAASCLPKLRLDPGQTLEFTVTYQPKVAGASEVEMSWTHDAANLPSPFRLFLEGE
jgi:hypothetical protein